MDYVVVFDGSCWGLWTLDESSLKPAPHFEVTQTTSFSNKNPGKDTSTRTSRSVHTQLSHCFLFLGLARFSLLELIPVSCDGMAKR